jgi:GNAT superfamily N-acetyltransferase
MEKKEIKLKNAPGIAGLQFRKFTGDADYPWMIDILNEASKADRSDDVYTLEDIKNDYAHLTNCDPTQDMIFAQVNDETIAYSRVSWYQEENPNDRIYSLILNIKPLWRSQGIEEAMIHWCESRLLTIAESHPEDSKRFFQTYSMDKKQFYNQIVEQLGYKVARYGFGMARSLDHIPQANLPEEVEVRPVLEKDIRKIWDASIEAFRDHWGFAEPTEEDFDGYQKSKYFQPALWQVAWHGDAVVGSILNYIDHDYNQKYNRKRGWTEEITTHRDWRNKGIASGLIVRSMQMHKAQGMTEVALGVDTQNPTGALHVYQKLGYQQEKTWLTYRKPL